MLNNLINKDSITSYVNSSSLIPGIEQVVRQAQEENPEIEAIALRPINIERIIDELAANGISTIDELDKKLNEYKYGIVQAFNNYDSGAIAARHVFTPIYLLLEKL